MVWEESHTIVADWTFVFLPVFCREIIFSLPHLSGPPSVVAIEIVLCRQRLLFSVRLQTP